MSGLLGTKQRQGHLSWPLTATSERAYGALAFVRVRVTSTHLQPYGAEWSRPARSSANKQVREDKGVEVLRWHLRAEEKSVTDVAPAFQQWRGRDDASEDVRMYIDGRSDVVGNATNRQGQVHVVGKAAKYAGAVGQAAATEAQRAAAKNKLGGRLRANRSCGSNSDGVRAVGGGVSSAEWWRHIVRPRPCRREEGSWGCEEGR